MDALSLLQQRNSCPQLQSPAPAGEQLEAMLRAATRVPDHGWIRPWRFISVSGDDRAALGELFVAAAEERQGPLSEQERDKFRQQPMRAPLLLVVVVREQQHPKVPVIEQWQSAACAAHSLLLAAEAQGFAGIWRTGVNATDASIRRGLGLAENEYIAAFLYLGTAAATAKKIPQLSLERYYQVWSPAAKGNS